MCHTQQFCGWDIAYKRFETTWNHPHCVLPPRTTLSTGWHIRLKHLWDQWKPSTCTATENQAINTEYDSFKNVFRHQLKITKNEQFQNHSSHKKLYRTFSLGTPLSSLNFQCYLRFRILDILSFLKSIVMYSYGGGAQGAYLSHGPLSIFMPLRQHEWVSKSSVWDSSHMWV